jgi:hypothetical protein
MSLLGLLISSMTPPPSSGLDTDAQAFITAASITDATQKSAINQLVLDLKAASIWTKMVAIYPYVGGAATPHSFNLKTPASFQITWGGTVTHNANGVTGNGSTGKGDTGLSPATSLGLNDTHMSVYSRTLSTATSAEMGSLSGSSGSYCGLFCKYTDNNMYAELWGTGAAPDEISGVPTNSQGLFTASRRAVNDFEIYRNSTSLNTLTGNRVGTRPTNNMYVLGQNNAGAVSNPSARNIAWHSFGNGLTDADVSALYTAVQAYQTTLGRQV